MMKNKVKDIVNELSIISMVLGLIVGVAFFNSCEEENDAPPKITRVRAIEPEEADIDLDGAGLNDWIVIQGENLATTQHVYFNNYEAGFNPAFVTETNIVLQIPAETPNIGTNPDAPNTVVVVTEFGEATHDFITFAPPAEIEYISNEYATVGDEITLEGRYFYGVESIIFTGDVEATEFTEGPGGLSCIVVVPEGIEPGPITVITPGGIGGSIKGATMWGRTGMMCDFDELNPWENWGGQVVNPASNEILPELSGNAFLATGTNVLTGTYWVQEMAMPIASGSYPNYDTISSADNILLKFELFADGPWNSGEYRVSLVSRNDSGAWVNTYEYYIKPWYIDEETQIDFAPNDWTTIAIPLSDFYNSDDENLKSFSELKDFDFFGFYFQNSGGLPGEQNIPLIHIGIDNIRMVGIESD